MDTNIIKNILAAYERVPDLPDGTQVPQSKGFLSRTKMPANKDNKNSPYAPLLDSFKAAQRIKKVRMEYLEGKKDG
tara:strand:+ start:300 stop:527 length:228 start_codon:yes stop_codon:yes gene_type:complete